MKIRLISAFVALLIIIPLIIIGGIPYKIGVLMIALLGFKEFIDIRNTKNKLPFCMQLLGFLFIALFVLYPQNHTEISTLFDIRILAGLAITFLTPTVLYHDKTKYTIQDAFYMIGGILFLGLAMNLLLVIRNMGLTTLFYLVLVTTMTDTYAYVTGILIGKHKLIESVSPKKTWEGTLGGTLFGVGISATFYVTVVNSMISLPLIILISLFLSLLGQFGDLVFSMIKRYYGKKDFSNIMPGHGGILDRLDSLIFVVLGFMFFLTVL